MEIENNSEVLTLKEVAAFLKLSVPTVKKYINSGELKSSRVGRFWRVQKDDLIDFINKRRAN